jgi:putative hemolysin
MELTGLGILIVLILVNAFFVAAEYSLVSARHTKIQELVERGSRQAARVQRAQGNIGFFIAANQLGITVVSLLTGVVAEPAIGGLVEPLLLSFGLSEGTANGFSLAIAIGISAILSVIFAELVPKSIAIAKAETLAMALIQPLEIFAFVFGPISRALEWAGAGITRLFGVKPAEGGKYTAHSEDEIRMIVNASSQQGVLDEGEKELVYNVFDFGDKTVRNIMTPRTKMNAIEADVPLRELLDEYNKHGYSRIPVYDDDKDNIVGVAYTRDVLGKLEELDHTTVRDIMRPAIFVPASMGLRDFVNRLREKKTHMAIVVDEHEGTGGLATLEDVLEELVGEIYDETDEPEVASFQAISDGVYLLQADMTFSDVEELLTITVNEEDEGEFETVSGFIMHAFGDIPKAGEMTVYDGWEFIVESADDRRVLSVRVQKLGENPPDPDVLEDKALARAGRNTA